jgi:protein-S-isoprenylcysteine O-methyltransferase Ste14
MTPTPAKPPKPWFPKYYADVVQRLRVPSGFVLALALAWLSQPNAVSLAVGLPVSLAGLALRAWAAGHLAKNEALAATGPYALTRNPLYAGTLLAAVGLAIASLSWLVVLLVPLVFLLVYFPVIEQEEAHLRNLFPSFAAYAEAVPMLAPRWPPHGKLSGFHWSLYRTNQEYQALAGFLLGYAYLAWRAGLWTIPWPL